MKAGQSPSPAHRETQLALLPPGSTLQAWDDPHVTPVHVAGGDESLVTPESTGPPPEPSYGFTPLEALELLASYTPELLDPPELGVPELDPEPDDPEPDEVALASKPLDDPEVPVTEIARHSPSA